MKHYIAMWSNILNFSGRTSRAGYWIAWVINVIVFALVGVLLPESLENVVAILANVATFTMLMRRIRDAGFPAILALLTFAGVLSLPFKLDAILPIVPTVLALLPSKK